MALKATIYKAEIQIADMDRHYYDTHTLTIARHPSETDERMMMRVLAFVRHAHAALSFGKGLSADDEPDLWQKDLTGAIEWWIDVGQPDEKRILKAAGRSAQVVVYSYSGHSQIWWEQIRGKIERAKNVAVYQVSPAIGSALAQLAQRSMQLQFTIQDGEIWLSAGEEPLHISLQVLRPSQSA